MSLLPSKFHDFVSMNRFYAPVKSRHGYLLFFRLNFPSAEVLRVRNTGNRGQVQKFRVFLKIFHETRQNVIFLL